MGWKSRSVRIAANCAMRSRAGSVPKVSRSYQRKEDAITPRVSFRQPTRTGNRECLGFALCLRSEMLVAFLRAEAIATVQTAASSPNRRSPEDYADGHQQYHQADDRESKQKQCHVHPPLLFQSDRDCRPLFPYPTFQKKTRSLRRLPVFLYQPVNRRSRPAGCSLDPPRCSPAY